MHKYCARQSRVRYSYDLQHSFASLLALLSAQLWLCWMQKIGRIGTGIGRLLCVALYSSSSVGTLLGSFLRMTSATRISDLTQGMLRSVQARCGRASLEAVNCELGRKSVASHKMSELGAGLLTARAESAVRFSLGCLLSSLLRDCFSDMYSASIGSQCNLYS